MSRYNEIFDKINPITDDDTLFENLKKETRVKRRISKKSIACIIAAAVVSTMTSVTALAYNWGFFDSVRSFFNDKNNVISEDINTPYVTYVNNSFKNMDISVTGAVRDEKFTIIFLDFTRNDGKSFDTSEYFLKDINGDDIIMSDGEKYSLKPSFNFGINNSHSISKSGIELTETSRCYLVDDDNPSDNRISLAYCISNFNYNVLDKFRIDIEDFTLESFYGQQRNDLVYLRSKDKEQINGNFLCEIDMNNITSISNVKNINPYISVTMPVADSSSPKQADYKFIINEITISDISIKITFEGEKSEKSQYIQTYNSKEIGKIILKDGSEIVFGNEYLPQIILNYTEKDKWIFKGDFVLSETIQIEDIKEIVINGITITL